MLRTIQEFVPNGIGLSDNASVLNASTFQESTTVYDGLGRAYRNTRWNVPQAQIDWDSVPAAGLNGVAASAGVTSQTDTFGDVTSTSYDKAGNVKTQTDAKNKVTTTVYDVLGRTKGVTDRLTNQTSYAYDLAGRMTSITDAQACFLVQNHQLSRQCTGAVTACQAAVKGSGLNG